MGANGSGTLWLDVPPTNQIPSAAYADGRYEQAGIGESPPSSDARHFFLFLANTANILGNGPSFFGNGPSLGNRASP